MILQNILVVVPLFDQSLRIASPKIILSRIGLTRGLPEIGGSWD